MGLANRCLSNSEAESLRKKAGASCPPAFSIHIKRKVCKSCVNKVVQTQKVIVSQALLAFLNDIPVADE